MEGTPIRDRTGGDLHETHFSGLARGPGIKATFLPDDRFDQHGRKGVTGGGRFDDAVVARGIPPAAVTPPCFHCRERRQNHPEGQEKQEDTASMFSPTKGWPSLPERGEPDRGPKDRAEPAVPGTSFLSSCWDRHVHLSEYRPAVVSARKGCTSRFELGMPPPGSSRRSE